MIRSCPLDDGTWDEEDEEDSPVCPRCGKSATDKSARSQASRPIHDGFDDRPMEELRLYHDKLLSDGWRPTRWRHPVWGDLELVVSDGFWIARPPGGNIWHYFRSDRAAEAAHAGRTCFKRDAEGDLIAVVPVKPETEDQEDQEDQ